MDEPATRQLVFVGPQDLVPELETEFQALGVDVQVPAEEKSRDPATALAIVSVVLAATGSVPDIYEAIIRFRQKHVESSTEVRVLPGPGSAKERLAELEELHQQGLVTDDELAEARNRILTELSSIDRDGRDQRPGGR